MQLLALVRAVRGSGDTPISRHLVLFGSKSSVSLRHVLRVLVILLEASFVDPLRTINEHVLLLCCLLNNQTLRATEP